MSHYVVGYHDHQMHTHEVCEYANDSYEAKIEATEDVPYIHEHPNCIDYIIKED